MQPAASAAAFTKRGSFPSNASCWPFADMTFRPDSEIRELAFTLRCSSCGRVIDSMAQVRPYLEGDGRFGSDP
jgi:hypothetical protein